MIHADSGTKFRVPISNAAGSATSNSATLTVNSGSAAPFITQQPTEQTVTVGYTATFAVVADGIAPLAYQWQKNGTIIDGATSATYVTPPTGLTDNGALLQVIISNNWSGRDPNFGNDLIASRGSLVVSSPTSSETLHS